MSPGAGNTNLAGTYTSTETTSTTAVAAAAATIPAPLPDDSPIPNAAAHDLLRQYPRHAVELQLLTVARYSRRRKLRAARWTCCHCGREQPYRDEDDNDHPTAYAYVYACAATGGGNGDPLAGLRCANPMCGVSGRGYRICRVHESESLFYFFFLLVTAGHTYGDMMPPRQYLSGRSGRRGQKGTFGGGGVGAVLSTRYT